MIPNVHNFIIGGTATHVKTQNSIASNYITNSFTTSTCINHRASANGFVDADYVDAEPPYAVHVQEAEAEEHGRLVDKRTLQHLLHAAFINHEWVDERVADQGPHIVRGQTSYLLKPRCHVEGL